MYLADEGVTVPAREVLAEAVKQWEKRTAEAEELANNAKADWQKRFDEAIDCQFILGGLLEAHKNINQPREVPSDNEFVAG